MKSVFDTPTTPGDCTLGVALPYSLAEVREHLKAGDKRDFVQHVGEKLIKNEQSNADVNVQYVERPFRVEHAEEIWQKRYKNISEKLIKTLESVQQNGVQVIHQFSLADFGNLKPFAVTTVFAHWSKPRKLIELKDGLHSADAVAEAIPKDYAGILDLTVCNSEILLERIKDSHPRCIILGNTGTASVKFRLIFYKHLINTLAQQSIHYVDAFTHLRLSLKR